MESELPHELDALVDERYAELVSVCRESGVSLPNDDDVAERIRRTLRTSDFAFETWRRQPQLLSASGREALCEGSDGATRARALLKNVESEDAAMAALRRFRAAEAARLVFRDVNGLDDLDAVLSATSGLYEALLDTALRWAEARHEARFGVARNAAGQAQHLIVMGFGKLGGGELNFSSDIDLVLAFSESGESDGERVLDTGEYFARLGQQLVHLLAHPTPDGIVARVDLRLRPFGQAGRLALSFGAMEQYYQRDGRDWERYAWIKARPVAGDLAAGSRLLEMLRPFIYRRYLDYTAFAGLREMKALIDSEVARKDLSQNIKLGPGGIREIEFVVQLTQLIRGGREPELRVRGLLPALDACEARGLFDKKAARLLRDAYRFLRRLENRLQMLRDEQTHDLPDDRFSRLRIARSMRFDTWDELAARLAAQRAIVTETFEAALVPEGGRHGTPAPAADGRLWKAARDEGLTRDHLAEAGLKPDADLREALARLPQAASVRAMSARSAARLDRLMPQMVAAARATAAPEACLKRFAALVQAVARRSAYLALLEEQPGAREHLAKLFAESAFLAERVIAQPLLLDDVLDPRIEQMPLKRADIAREIARVLDTLDERHPEGELERINEVKASVAFRLGLLFSDQHAEAVATARRLAALADAVIGAVLTLGERELAVRHGRLPGSGSGFAVIGYGSLGGAELGFASDLDLVFLYDAGRADSHSNGARALEGVRWYQRLAQRVVHWLTALNRSGRMYEVDTRLRPDGSKGLLVTSVQAFTAYQRERAWTWEHQALIRSRPVAGDHAVQNEFVRLRRDILGAPRTLESVQHEVASMRRRWRAERDRSDAQTLDLKQGAGGLLDIEFLLQGLVLAQAESIPALLQSSSTSALLRACRDHDVLDPAQYRVLAQVHKLLLRRSLKCTLDARPRRVARDETVQGACEDVLAVARALGFSLV